MSGVIKLNGEEFKARVLEGKGTALVAFWAGWCKPCVTLLPDLDLLAGNLVGSVEVFLVDFDENRHTISLFGIRGVPSLFVFRDGEVIASHVGRLGLTDLTALVTSNLLSTGNADGEKKCKP